MAPGRLKRPFELDLRSLAVFRVGLALLLLYDLADRARDLRAHYTDAGVLPRDWVPAPPQGNLPLSLHLLDGSAGFQAALFALAALVALALLAGWKTRQATLLSWLLLMSLQLRNPLLNYEADRLLLLLLFWSLFLPLGGRWSVDARKTHQDRRAVVSFGSAALVLQVCLVYWFALLYKSGPTWWDGTAVFYALHADQYARPLAVSIREHAGLVSALTWGTLIIEGLAPVLLLCRSALARLLGLTLLAGLQVGFLLCMDLGIFPWVSLLALLPLIPSRVWDGPTESGRVVSDRRPIQALAWALVMAVLAWNVCGLTQTPVPGPLRKVYGALGLDQAWPMFAPDPMTDDGWFVVTADLDDRTSRDLLTGQPLSWEKPPLVSAAVRGDRPKEHLMVIYENPEQPWRRLYGEYLVREWEREHGSLDGLRRLRIIYVREETQPEGPAAPIHDVLWIGP